MNSYGNEAVDGDFAVSVGNTTSSFDDFLASFAEEETGSFSKEDLDANATEEHNDFEDFESFEEMLKEGKEETEEEAEESEAEEIEKTEVVFEDWDQTFTLPDGTEVTGADIRDFKNFGKLQEDFVADKQKYHQREKLMVEEANIGYAAIGQMEQQLVQLSSQRPLTIMEQAQLQSINIMKHQFESFSNNLKSTYEAEFQKNTAMREHQVDMNINSLFDEYQAKGMNFAEEIGTVKQYLGTKGFDSTEVEQLMNTIGYDKKLIGVLMDASAGERAKAKVKVNKATKASPSPVKSTVKPEKKEEFKLPHGVSSRDAESYKAFATLGL